ncbi:hypothetical protein [Mucilaginibacter sp. NFX135]|uniref:hypothetical protein n=1 Tax=Mucilaginibacter sp. NFX135 TaxID=3402687 RepID=UPI003AFA8FEF
MKYKIIAPIENLQLEPNTSIELIKFVFTNHNSDFEAITEGEGFDTYIGESGLSEFFNGTFLYYMGDFDEAESNSKFKTIPEFLNQFHSKLNFLFNLLWFVKDNSIVINNFYCKDLENNTSIL